MPEEHEHLCVRFTRVLLDSLVTWSDPVRVRVIQTKGGDMTMQFERVGATDRVSELNEQIEILKADYADAIAEIRRLDRWKKDHDG